MPGDDDARCDWCHRPISPEWVDDWGGCCDSPECVAWERAERAGVL